MLVVEPGGGHCGDEELGRRKARARSDEVDEEPGEGRGVGVWLMGDDVKAGGMGEESRETE